MEEADPDVDRKYIGNPFGASKYSTSGVAKPDVVAFKQKRKKMVQCGFEQGKKENG